MLKALDSASNFIRALVSLGIMAVISVAGWLGYDKFYANELAIKQKDEQIAASQREIESLNQEVQTRQREIERLDTALRLLKVDHRAAQIEVLDQQRNPQTGRLATRFTFVETDDEGHPLETPREFNIEGDVLYVDAYVVSFRDEYVEKGDPLRGTALRLLRRLYGEYQSPSEGASLDPVGGRPAAYGRNSEPSELEKKIWEDFWEYANNPKKAEDAGVRAAQGKASYTQLRPQMHYRLMFRNTGDFTILPETQPQQRPL
jgi:hypothetical protein